LLPPPTTSTLFPYTTLFRSLNGNTGNWVGVTNEWLGLGFGRGLLPRTAPGSDVTGHPNAILIFQKLADRNADGAINGSDTPAPKDRKSTRLNSSHVAISYAV